MTNKTEHDSHGSKTVEISDMKYNIFKVCGLLYLFFVLFIFSHIWKLRGTRLNITGGNFQVELEFISAHLYFRSILIFGKTFQVGPT